MPRKKITQTPEKKVRASRKAEKQIDPHTDQQVELIETDEDGMASRSSNGLSSNRLRLLVIGGAIILILGLMGYRYRYLLVPAQINGRPVFAWEYVGALHQYYGSEVLNSVVTQKLIEQEVANQKINVSEDLVNAEVDKIDKQASASGGIKALLDAQQTTMQEFQRQVRTQLAVKELLKDKIRISDAEINDAYNKNKDFFKGIPEAQARENVREQLENDKFRTEATTWLNDLRTRSKVSINIPGFK